MTQTADFGTQPTANRQEDIMAQTADFGTPPPAPAVVPTEHAALVHLRHAYVSLGHAVLAAGDLAPQIANAIDAARATVADAAKKIKEIV